MPKSASRIVSSAMAYIETSEFMDKQAKRGDREGGWAGGVERGERGHRERAATENNGVDSRTVHYVVSL